jgi:hypothetical protein
MRLLLTSATAHCRLSERLARPPCCLRALLPPTANSTWQRGWGPMFAGSGQPCTSRIDAVCQAVAPGSASAIGAFEKAVALDATQRACLCLASAYEDAGQKGKVVDALRRAAERLNGAARSECQNRAHLLEAQLANAGRCFVATACCGSADSSEVVSLRVYRDRVLCASRGGRWFIRLYGRYGPRAALFLIRRPTLARLLRRVIIAPLAAAARTVLSGLDSTRR